MLSATKNKINLNIKKMEFKKLTSELERLKELNLRVGLNENGKEIMAELELALSICVVGVTLPSREEIDIEARKRAKEVKYPKNSPELKHRVTFRKGCDFIIKHLEKDNGN